MSSLKPGRLSLLFAGLLLTAVAAPSPAAQPDPLLPADAEMVMTVNVTQILQSPLYKKYASDQVKALMAQNQQTQAALTALGLDPLRDISQVVVSNAGGTADGKMLVIFHGQYDLDRFQKVAKDVAAKNPKFKILQEGTREVFHVESNNGPIFGTFLDKGTFVLSPTKDYLLGSIQKPGAQGLDPTLKGAIQQANANQSMWVAVLVTEEMKKAMGANPQTQQFAPKLKAVTGAFHVTDAAQANIVIQTTDAESAGQISNLLGQFIPVLKVLAQGQGNEQAGKLLGELLNNLKIGAKQNSVDISLKISEDTVLKALNQN